MNSNNNQTFEIDTKIVEIKKTAQDIIELGADVRKNEAEIKEKMRRTVSLVGFVISYPETNPDSSKNPLVSLAANVFELLDKCPGEKGTIMTYLKLFGDFANNLADAVTRRRDAEK